MPELRAILTTEIEPLIRAAYAEDVDLLMTFHQSAGKGLDVCVAKTMENITPTTRFFKIENNTGAFVGFFGMALPINDQVVLEGFCLRKNYRNADYVKSFWDLINTTINQPYYTGVSENNTRAQDHLLKNNFQIVERVAYQGIKFVIFKTKN